MNNDVNVLRLSPIFNDLKSRKASEVSFVHSVKEEDTLEVTHGSDLNIKLKSKGEDATKDIDSLSREDLGREIGSRWTGKKTEQQNHDVDDKLKKIINISDKDDTEEHMDDVGNESNDDSSSSYNYEPDEEVDMSGIMVGDVGFSKWRTPVDTSEAETVGKEYDEANGKNLKNFEESYNVMLFSNGDNCWNGPDRSLKVKLRCRLKVKVADICSNAALNLDGKLKSKKGGVTLVLSSLSLVNRNYKSPWHMETTTKENGDYQSSGRLCNLCFLEYLKLYFFEYEHVAVNLTCHGLDTATIGKPASLGRIQKNLLDRVSQLN
ncbi:glucosidase 2 subunit beta-like protein isoform X1 [Tanacetum coccineum]